MAYAFIAFGVAVLVTAIVLIAAKVWKKKSPKGENPLAELNELKEKGLITEQEYNEKKVEILSRGGKKWVRMGNLAIA